MVCRAMSITSPSADSCGISIQSPTRTMSLLAICTLATSDSSVSLKTSNSTAVIAPRPLSSSNGERSIRTETISTPEIRKSTILASCT